MRQKHSPVQVSPLCQIMNTIDCYLHRINVIYLLRGYRPLYSLSIATFIFLIFLTFVFPPQDTPLYTGGISFLALSFALLIIAGGLFRVSGGIIVRRQRQEEWILGNIKDIINELLEITSSKRVCYFFIGLEVVAQLGKRIQGAACICLLLLIWMSWIVVKKRNEIFSFLMEQLK